MSKKAKRDSALEERPGVIQNESLNPKAAKSIKKLRGAPIDVDQLTNGILAGDAVALSRGITLVESTANKHQKLAQQLILNCLQHTKPALRIGITGVPGVGKSTFIEQMGNLLIGKGHKVAVLAIDPSSSLNKGSILGDKTRMDTLVRSENAFIRPSASGESLGGVARKTREAIVLCEAAGYDYILIETVGVGQSETAVHSMTDFFLLLKLAGAGDELQGIKRGIIEMADAIVINKADGENQKAARLAKTEFNRALHLYPAKDNGWSPKTLTCSAIENQGIEQTLEMIHDFAALTKENGHFENRRKEQQEYWFRQTVSNTLLDDFYKKPEVKKEITSLLKAMDDKKITPFEAAYQLLKIKK
ncbi:MAG: methylmalonyl Co-A mutase-associated GTPase MeaB [Gilvibacter sp.]